LWKMKSWILCVFTTLILVSLVIEFQKNLKKTTPV
jgi:hypothetical protein